MKGMVVLYRTWVPGQPLGMAVHMVGSPAGTVVLVVASPLVVWAATCVVAVGSGVLSIITNDVAWIMT